VQDWGVALLVPGRIIEVAIEAVAPDDHRITFTVESGAVITVLGRDVYDPPALNSTPVLRQPNRPPRRAQEPASRRPTSTHNWVVLCA
jgi:hypothetical protein